MPGVSSLMELVARLTDQLEDGTLTAGFMEPVRRGSASGFVLVIPADDRSSDLVLMVRLEIMTVPGRPSPRMYRRLLELNHGFLGRASFSVGPEGKVCLTAGRPLEDLDPSEVVDLILWTSEQADLYDDMLLREFGEHGLTSTNGSPPGPE